MYLNIFRQQQCQFGLTEILVTNIEKEVEKKILEVWKMFHLTVCHSSQHPTSKAKQVIFE